MTMRSKVAMAMALAVLAVAALPETATAGTLRSYGIVSASNAVDGTMQSYETVACPSGTVVIGGGAQGGSQLEINSSWPVDSTHWGVYMDNPGIPGDIASYTAYAVCAKQPRRYSIVNSVFVAGGIVPCPAQSKVLGGGVYMDSRSVSDTLAVTAPYKNGWQGRVNINSGGSPDFTISAICGAKPNGYVRVTSLNAATALPGAIGTGAANCPVDPLTSVQTVPLSGGAGTGSLDKSLSIHGSEPLGSSWSVSIFNGTASSIAVQAYALCADP